MMLRSRVPARWRDHHLGVRLWPALWPSLQHPRTSRDRVIRHTALVTKSFQRPLGADKQCLVCISKNVIDMILVCSCLQHPSVRAVAVFVVTTKRRVKDERRATHGKRTNYLWKVAIKAYQLANCTKGRWRSGISVPRYIAGGICAVALREVGLVVKIDYLSSWRKQCGSIVHLAAVGLRGTTNSNPMQLQVSSKTIKM